MTENNNNKRHLNGWATIALSIISAAAVALGTVFAYVRNMDARMVRVETFVEFTAGEAKIMRQDIKTLLLRK